MVVRHVGVWSVARMYGALTAAMGLLFGVVLALLSVVGLGIMSGADAQDAPAWLAPLFGVGAIILFPICYGVMGLVVGAVTAVFYNILAAVVGGISLDVDQP